MATQRLSLTTLRTEIIDAYARNASEKHDAWLRTLGSMQYAGIRGGGARARIDVLATEFSNLINSLDLRALLGALPQFTGAKLPMWVLRGEYTVDCDDKDWYLFRTGA